MFEKYKWKGKKSRKTFIISNEKYLKVYIKKAFILYTYKKKTGKLTL